MTVMLRKVYDAFRAANVPDEVAAEAAQELASYENRFAGIEQKLTILDGRVSLLMWMVGFNLAMTSALLFKALS